MTLLNNNSIGRQIRKRYRRLPGIMNKKVRTIIWALVLALLPVAVAQAALEIEVIAAPNFVVDSNVLTPATYAPNASMIGAKFCNTGGAPLTDVRAYVGNYGTGRGDSSGDTPGVYPKRYSNTFSGVHDHLYRASGGGYYSMTHEGGTAGAADAFRFIKEIPAGECKVQYWLTSYPKTSDNEKEAGSLLAPEKSVTGGDVGPEDDLWLEYDIWADATGESTVWTTTKATMRNEISAMANKIWPNGDNKVPTEYKEAIDAFLGWDTATPSGTSATYPGDIAVAQGVWYDFGVVGAGFDNDGDLVPDHNAWAQPIGDAGAYDPGCFRLISTEAYVLVKRQDGSVDIFDYKDRLYFENMPDNTGSVGLVFYNFTALDGKCTAGLSPYQEVASGYDNEKFNGDYGVGTPPLQSIDPSGNLPITKDGPANITVPALAGGWADMHYDITYQNNRTAPVGSTLVLSIGDVDGGLTMVVRDTVPAGTFYKIGSAEWTDLEGGDTIPEDGSGNDLYVPGTILFSTDGGITWSENEPVDTSPADGYADAPDVRIQWWIDSVLPSTAPVNQNGTGIDFSVKVEFDAGVPFGYSGSSVICNTGELAVGTGPAINEASDCTLVSGPNSIDGTVFKDLNIDGLYDNPADPVLDNIHVTLYTDLGLSVIDGLLDMNNDGVISAADDGSFGGYTVVDGWVDIDGDGDTGADAAGDLNAGADADDDGSIGIDNAWSVIDGQINVDTTNAAIDTADDGRIWDGIFDANDLLVAEMDSGAVTTGEYNFANLPDGVYFVQVDSDDSDLFTGAAPTTSTSHTVRLDIVQGDGNDAVAVDSVDNDFGFIEPLKITKAVTSTTAPYGDEEKITYSLTVENQLPPAGSDVNGQCVYTLFPSTNPGANSAWTNTENVYAIDANYADVTVGSNSDAAEFSGFVAPVATGDIVDFKVLIYDAQAVGGSGDWNSGDSMDALISNTGGTIATSAEVDLTVIAGGYSYVYSDLHEDYASWQWSEISDFTLGVTTHKSGAQPSDSLRLDAVALQITSSDPCPAGSDNTITDIRLQDRYENAKLTHVNSTPTEASDNVDIGDSAYNILVWNNVGPLAPGESTVVTVVMQGQNDTAATISAANTALVAAGEASFGDGDSTNAASDAASVDIEPGLDISGKLFADDTAGWNTASPFGDDPGNDTYLAGQTVELWACATSTTGTILTGANETKDCDSNGGYDWYVLETTTTAADGSYTFAGVTQGYYYVKAPDTAYGGAISAAPLDENNPTTTGGPNDAYWWEPGNDGGGNNEDLNLFFRVGGASANWTDSDNVDFGYTTNGALSGTVWKDVDGDGIPDIGDDGLSGITVELIDCGADNDCDLTGDNSISTTVTDTDGYYEFINLTAGQNYRVNVLTLLDGEGGATGDLATGTWEQTQETTDGEAASPGNDGTIDQYIDFQAAAGLVLFDRDFGYQEEGTRSIDGTVYYDWDGDGTQGAGEIGTAGVTIYLYEDENGDGVIDPDNDTLVATVTTDANGDYFFDNTLAEFTNGLPSQEFLVVVEETDASLNVYEQIEDPDVAPGGGICVGSQCDGDGKADVTAGDQTGIDFGYQPQGSNALSGQLWQDLDSDTVKDGGQEVGIADVTVTLQWTSDGGTTWHDIQTTTGSDGTTDVDGDGLVDLPGSYWFGDLPDGTYRVKVSENDAELPLDASGQPYTPTTGTDDGAERYFEQTLSGGGTNANNNFGFTLLGAIGDQVYWDVNTNGEQDRGEPGIAGVTVTLYTFTDDNGDGKYDIGETLSAPVDTAVTDADGYYLFNDLAANHYMVEVDRTSGPIVGKTLTSDPDSDGVACNGYTNTSESCDATHGVPITSTQYLNADFGYEPENVLGDIIWLDANQDGVQDAGELGVVGVTVELQDGTCTPGSTCPTAVTDQDGYYVFTDLVPGTDYTVVVDNTTLPVGLTATHNWVGDLDVPINNSTQLPTWVAGETNLDIDFGYFYTGTNDLSGTLCLDDPGSPDGICGAGTSGVGVNEDAYTQVSVNLYRWDDVANIGIIDPGEEQYIGSTFTDANGDYSFADLADGTYWVSTAAPEQYIALTATAPTDTDIPNAAEISVNSAADGSTIGAFERTFAVSGGADITGLDFAFEEIFDFDYGDLPSTYPTLRDDNGARHIDTGVNNLYLGATPPDTEADGIPDAAAQGDGADEDGIVATPATWTEGPGGGSVNVTVTGSGWLVAWIDLDGDGSFGTYGEMIISQAVTTGTAPYTFDIPGGTFDASQGYARFRLFPEEPVIPQLAYFGTAEDGEVEDIQFDFGTESGVIGNRVWLDENGDGKQDAGENGIPNVDVYLYDSSNVLQKTVTTDANGEYIFTGLAAGDWTVRTVQTNGTTTTLPSDLNPTYDEDGIATGNVSIVTLANGEEYLTADFGYNWVTPAVTDTPASTDTGAIGDRIWSDGNGDGIQDAEEPGISGVDLYLLFDLNGDGIYGGGGDGTDTNADGIYGGPGDADAVTETTDAAGYYVFTDTNVKADNAARDLGVGSYVVYVDDTSLPTTTTWNQTGDPDPNNDDKTTSPVLLGPGDVYLQADFGYEPTNSGTITGTFYLDVDADACTLAGGGTCGDAGDNLLNGNDKGFPGVTVALKDSSGNIIATTITDSNGNYTFDGVPYDADGETYTVSVTDTRHILGEVTQSGDPDSTLDNQHQLTLSTATPTVSDVNFGYTPPDHATGQGLIGDTIFLDSDQGGDYDLGEGLEGVAVSLYKDGALVAVTQTDENGWYQFGNLDPTETDYEVRVKTTTIPNHDLTLYNSVDPDNDDNSRSAVNLFLATDNQDLQRDFGYDKLSGDNSISGTLWNDGDANGTLTDGTGGTPDEQTAGIGGVTIHLLDSEGNIVGTTTTISVPTDLDGDTIPEPAGSYLFNELPDGDYTVEISDDDDVLTGYWLADGPADGTDNNSQPASYDVTLNGSEDNSTGDFGFFQETTSIGNYLWLDTNGDGDWDVGEPPMVFYQVKLTITYPNGAETTLTTMTDIDGLYSFDNIMLDEDYNAAGGGLSYTITVPSTGDLVSSHTITSDGFNDADGVTAADNQADNPDDEQVNGLVKGETDNTRDFGFVGGATIGDRIWLDLDRAGADEGMQNIGDPGLSGITVELYRDVDQDGFFEPGGDDGAAVLTTVTDGNGNYSFEGIPPGDYWVDVDETTLPTGLVAVTADLGGDDTLDSDLDADAGGATVVTVTSGEVVETQDFGYVGTSPLLGDTIWYDADGNGIQDLGEPGLKGVDVVIHPCGLDGICGNDDDNWGPDGVDNSGGGDDIADMTATTDAAGNYLQPVAAGTYSVTVTTGTLPAGLNVTPTNGTSSREYTVPADADILHADFGFELDSGTEYTIGNLIWEDDNGDGVKDAGETNGIAGVTVDLYRDGIPIATTTTAADGTYAFKVVETGADADYEVRVTDRDSILDGRTLTSGTANTNDNSQADPFIINDLTGDINYADFGYQGLNIGDRIWHDLNDNGIQDAGESGLNGVKVHLYLDNNEDGSFDGGDLLVRTTLTADGRYDFTGIPAGKYLVKLDPDNFTAGKALEDFKVVPADAGGDDQTDSDNPGSDGLNDSHVVAVELTGSSDYSTDFGFRYEPAAALYSIGDLVWLDTDAQGDQDAGEEGLEGITVSLYLDRNNDGKVDAGDQLLQVTTSSDGTTDVDGDTVNDPKGSYYFGPVNGATGLPPGHYLVVIGDGDELNGYRLTTGSTNPRDVTIVNADITDADFGLAPIVSTYAVFSSFKAYVNAKKQTVLEWTTASEIGTIGFFLERLNEQSGTYQAVNTKLLPGMLSPPHGGTYRYIDKTAKPGRKYTYRVVEVAVNSQGTISDPYTVQASKPLPVNNEMFAGGSEGYSLTHQDFSKKELRRFAARGKVAFELAAAKRNKTGNILKVPVSKSGMVYLAATELAASSGIPHSQVVQYLKGGKCLVTLAGASVSLITANTGSGIWFYGQAPDRNDIGQNVYLLELGKKGVKVKNMSGRAKEVVAEERSFVARAKVEENHQPIHLYINTPVKDFWAWEYMFAYGTEASLNHNVDSPYMTGEGEVVLTVNLVGMTNSNSGQEAPYKVAVFLNDVEVGIAEWSEQGDYTFQGKVSADLLREGGNEVRLVSQLNSGVVYSFIYLDSFELDYQRSYQAVNGELIFANAEYDSITVQGFSSSNVLALDITNPNKPLRLRTLPGKNEAGEYTITILTKPEHNYFMTENIGLTVSSDITVDSPSQLHNRDNHADYLVISPLNMMSSAQRLADYRAAQGMTAMTIDIEDIQDEFSHALAAPEAVHKFLAYVYENWSIPPQYVVLIGDGSYDYKDYLGYGYPVVPTELVATEDGFFPSDNRFADVVGDDGIPEFAIGRIPVVNSLELNEYIEKLISYEQGASYGENSVLNLVTDRADSTAGDFRASAAKIAELMPKSFSVNHLDAGSLGNGGTHSGVAAALRQGGGIMHYVGHSSLIAFGRSSSLLTASEIESMSDTGSPMLMVSMACSTASFGYPAMRSIGEAAVLRADGVAAGFFGATGLSKNYLADIMAEGFYRGLLDPTTFGVGDAVVKAKRDYAAQGLSNDPLYIYNFLGDPAMSVPAGSR
ncbi:hypothetical protein GMJAKD_05000 [Candidatus Electrothrix aarhusensis]